MIAFLKKHWTWISGLIALVANYSIPAVTADLTSFFGAHASAKIVFFAVLAFLAHVSPSPLPASAKK